MSTFIPVDGAPSELGSSYGVMLISTVITAAQVSSLFEHLLYAEHIISLYGCTLLQALYYFEKFSKDPWPLKMAVSSLPAVSNSC